jgi:undecaprenyl diphosphate synthase
MNDNKIVAPKHIGIIPDGNRRWAKEKNLGFEDAYWCAMQKLANCLEILFDYGSASICVFLLSKDNIFRARDDLDAVVKAELRFLEELVPPLKAKFSFQIYHAGNLNIIPAEYAHALSQMCDAGNGLYTPFPRLYLCIGYDPYEEIVQVCTKNDFNSTNLIEMLSVPFELDAIIRTGGDTRISGFLPLQSKYAEFFFESYFFPDISKDRIIKIINEFNSRCRRFGK